MQEFGQNETTQALDGSNPASIITLGNWGIADAA